MTFDTLRSECVSWRKLLCFGIPGSDPREEGLQPFAARLVSAGRSSGRRAGVLFYRIVYVSPSGVSGKEGVGAEEKEGEKKNEVVQAVSDKKCEATAISIDVSVAGRATAATASPSPVSLLPYSLLDGHKAATHFPSDRRVSAISHQLKTAAARPSWPSAAAAACMIRPQCSLVAPPSSTLIFRKRKPIGVRPPAVRVECNGRGKGTSELEIRASTAGRR